VKINITKLEQTDCFAKILANYIQSSDELNIVYLEGNLGAGKTTLVRYVLRHMGWTGSVKSPTFSILEEYAINDHEIFHADLYRIDGENDFEMLGLEISENKKATLFIEWPNKISKFNLGNEIFLSLIIDKQERALEIRTECEEFLRCIDRVNINNPV